VSDREEGSDMYEFLYHAIPTVGMWIIIGMIAFAALRHLFKGGRK
jgi:hypothetical protein